MVASCKEAEKNVLRQNSLGHRVTGALDRERHPGNPSPGFLGYCMSGASALAGQGDRHPPLYPEVILRQTHLSFPSSANLTALLYRPNTHVYYM